MDQRFWISVVVMFLLSIGLGYFVHGVLLADEYARLPTLFRPPDEAQAHYPLTLLAHALIAFGFTWVYRQGYHPDKSPLAQGLRFGVAIAVLMTAPTYLGYYVVQPIPGALAAKQIAFDAITVVVMGIVAAQINRTQRAV